ncbi:MAG: 4'-phosphopantetheinyl transferase superfamily protein [Alistipes shahii]|uniref:4'-phosphopantetheinyl transferase family protein n=1 Tax=Alistipes shahii TaxID=328814 RepID=UPI00399D270D
MDIEPATRDFRRAASRYLTPEEEALSDDPLLPGIVWCAKETLYKYAGRRELDFRRDLHVVRLDLAAGTLAGRIGNGEPVRLSVSLDEGFILVYIL